MAPRRVTASRFAGMIPRAMSLYSEPRFLPAGDTALVVEFGDAVDPAINARVLALDARLAASPPPGLLETVPTYRSLMVYYDPLILDPAALTDHIGALLEGLEGAVAPGRLWTLPVAYGGSYGEDLGFVAETHGLTEKEVVERHAAAEYRVYMIGFSPGFAYLGGLDPVLHTPRRTHPRPRIPAGSVSIGGIQAAVSSVAGPSGWHLLGQTPVRLFDPGRDPVFLVAVGDRVRFQRIGHAEYAALEARGAAGEIVAQVE